MAVRRHNLDHARRLDQFLELVGAEPCSTTAELAEEAGVTASAARLYLMELWRRDLVDFRRAGKRSSAFIWTLHG
jgi:DNA-binding IclR family transcriptional regulator